MDNVQGTALQTVGVIAKRFNVPIHRVVYVIRAKGIKPAATAGISRVFDEADVVRIGEALAKG